MIIVNGFEFKHILGYPPAGHESTRHDRMFSLHPIDRVSPVFRADWPFRSYPFDPSSVAAWPSSLSPFACAPFLFVFFSVCFDFAFP